MTNSKSDMTNLETINFELEYLEQRLGLRVKRALEDSLKFQESLAKTAGEIRALARKLNTIADILEKGTAKTKLHENLYTPFMEIHGKLKSLHSNRMVGNTTTATTQILEREASGERVMEDYNRAKKRLLARKTRAERLLRGKDEEG